MKTLLLAIFSLCFCLSVVVALSQDAPNQAARKPQIQEDGDRLRFVTEGVNVSQASAPD